MAVFLDGVPAISDEDDNATVQMCYESLFAYCYEKKIAIETTKINGNEVNIEELRKYFDVHLKDIESLEFFTMNQVDLFERFIKFGEQFIEEAEKLENISTLINAGHVSDALAIVKDVSFTMHNLLRYHRYFALFDLPLQYPVGDSNILEYKDKINPLLSQLLDAFQAKDTVEFSDLAEYELAPIIRELGEGLEELTN